jgi:hypothetical protein
MSWHRAVLRWCYLQGRATQAPARSKYPTCVRDTQSKLLSEIAGAVPAGKESTGATMHRQHPVRSHRRKGDPRKNVEALEQAMDRAVKADETDNLAECEIALTEARRILDQAKR